ncbi:MAG: hypothetical protein KF764_32245 [Labilithrix sp.]|nr:hypothetical protein [Labilithrix sp.]
MRRGIALGPAFAALLCFVSIAPDARAQADVARQHFEAGKKLRDQGDCAGAIPEFNVSLAADKSVGALYNLGYCHEQLGQRQQAYDAYKQAQQLASARKDDRLREVSGALAGLLETPHIRLVLPQPLPDGIEIRVDGELVPASVYSAETVIFTKDAQSHTVTVTAPGYEDRNEVVATKHVKPIELRPKPTATEPDPPPPPPTPTVEAGGWTWQHWSGLGATAAGVGLLAVGSVMFISYVLDESSLYDRYQTAKKCPRAPEDTKLCAVASEQATRDDLRGQYDQNERDVRDKAPVILGTAIGGAVLIGGGLLLYLTAPRGRASDATTGRLQVLPIFGQTTQGAALTGTF